MVWKSRNFHYLEVEEHLVEQKRVPKLNIELLTPSCVDVSEIRESPEVHLQFSTGSWSFRPDNDEKDLMEKKNA